MNSFFKYLLLKNEMKEIGSDFSHMIKISSV